MPFVSDTYLFSFANELHSLQSEECPRIVERQSRRFLVASWRLLSGLSLFGVRAAKTADCSMR